MIPVFTRMFAVTTVCLAMLLSLATPLSARSNPESVLVFAFENQTDDRNIDWIGTGLSELVVERLSAERDLYIFNRDERTTAYERMGIPESAAITRATAMSIAWDTGADFIVIGRIYGTHQDFRIEARILNLQDSSSGLNVIVGQRPGGPEAGRPRRAARLAAALARRRIPGCRLADRAWRR